MKRVAYHNLGCKVNSYEIEAVTSIMKEAGYSITPFDEEADVYIINTCSVTNIADHKSRQMINKARKRNDNAIVIAMGCFVQEIEDEDRRKLNCYIIIGNNRKHNILDDIDRFKKEKSLIIDCEDINNPDACYENLRMTDAPSHTRAFIKVQDGCNEFCSYCIIPYARGRVRSRDIGDIENEINNLAMKGCKEFVLTGIHISSYSVEEKVEKRKLIDLIERVNNIEGVKRIRLGSLEPRIITDDFLKRLVKAQKVCPHFHLSLQSGCDSVLKRMNRKYTTEDFSKSAELIRRYYDNPALTTDIIVGFPGETEEEFDVTYDFLSDIHFHEMHIFKYSRRKGTRADKMDDQIPESIKKERSKKLINLSNKMSEEYMRSYLDREVEVLFEEEVVVDDVRYFQGYSREYIKVLIKSDDDLSNKIIVCVGKNIVSNCLLVEKIK